MPDKSQMDSEWEARTLCSDGDCIGVIGPDGRCLECGRPYDGDLPESIDAMFAPAESSEDSDNENAQDPDSSRPADGSATEAPASADDEWAARKLCEDESCIGVIGPDGHCLECGRRAKSG